MILASIKSFVKFKIKKLKIKKLKIKKLDKPE